MEKIRITECPRDAMQGIREFIDTPKKADYINSLLDCGFDTIDFGSFVSPKAIPQMRDTAEVLRNLNFEGKDSDLLAIVANRRGAEDACSFDEIRYLGYPFSISETFQQRNTNSSIEESLSRVEEIQNLAQKHGKDLLIYISMAFGNPYGDAWSPEMAAKWIEKLGKMEIKYFALADTIGISNPENVSELFNAVIPEFPSFEIGAHLHTNPAHWYGKVDAAYKAGCRKFDSAIKGYGGCPMAKDDLTGNLDTISLKGYCDDNKIESGINEIAFANAVIQSGKVF
jgi:hydroxymethylglutaryl-CoA lyase